MHPLCCWAARLKLGAAASGTAAAGQLLSKVPSPRLPAQAWTLLLVGPFIDKLASNDWVFNYTFTQGATAGGQVGQQGGAACTGSSCLALRRWRPGSCSRPAHTAQPAAPTAAPPCPLLCPRRGSDDAGVVHAGGAGQRLAVHVPGPLLRSLLPGALPPFPLWPPCVASLPRLLRAEMLGGVQAPAAACIACWACRLTL